MFEQAMQQLASADAGVRREAARKLGELKDARGVEPLIERLQQDQDEMVRQEAADALGQIGDGRALGPLLLALADPYDSVGEYAKAALRSVDPFWTGSSAARDQVPGIISRLGAPNGVARSNLAWALGMIKDRRAIGPLAGLQADQVGYVRQEAQSALGKIDSKWLASPEVREALPKLMAAMNSPDRGVRGSVALLIQLIEKHSKA